MNDVTLLIDIAAALIVAFFGGLIARRLGLPTIIGYLLAGIAIGPFTPGFVGDIETLGQLAELGVIFIMFDVGLQFSLAALWKVRDIAIPGALGQMAVTLLLGFGLSQVWNWGVSDGIILGLAISIASTVVLLRGLTDNSLLNTTHGQIAIGWLVMQDLVTVFILVLIPVLAQPEGALDWQTTILTVLKATLFMILMRFVGARLIPRLLRLIAHTRSRELFILAILAVALGTALSASELFGVSLALGAFLAGIIISESPLSHQVGADVLPFREAFSALFFVSIGMLVNPAFLVKNLGAVLALTALIVIGKPIVITLMGIWFSRPARSILVVAIGNAQIGEFSFILGQAGLALGLLDLDQYSLILSGALLSIPINSLMFRFIWRIENGLQHWQSFWRLLDRHGPAPVPVEETLSQHVVVVGYGQVGRHIVNVLESLHFPILVIEADVGRVEELNQRGVVTLFGEAANSEVITHAGLERAIALVITEPEESASELIVAAARDLATDLPIIARAATEEGVKRLAELGANDVIHPELEGGLEIVRHTLLRLGLPLQEINRYTDAVRRDHYDLQINTEEEHRLLHGLLSATSNIEVTWLKLSPDNPLVGQTLAEANLRARTGASVVAILRNKELMANPKSMTVFEADDRLGFIGEREQLEAVERLVAMSGNNEPFTHAR